MCGELLLWMGVAVAVGGLVGFQVGHHQREIGADRLAKLRLKAGDLVIIEMARLISPVDHERIRELLKRALPPDVKAIVLDAGSRAHVVQEAEEKTAEGNQKA